MPYSAAAVANAFLELAGKAGKPLTNMKLQKLVYIAHGWTLALLGRSLLYEDVQAWVWGPVIPTLYKSLRRYGSGVVEEVIPTDEQIEPDSREMNVIEGVWKAYGKYSATQLSGITHQKGTPWSEVWPRDPSGEIPSDLIKHHYVQLKNERSNARREAAE